MVLFQLRKQSNKTLNKLFILSDMLYMHVYYCGMYLAVIVIIIILIVMKHWEKLIVEGPPEMVYFFMPGCKFCEAFDPIWEEFLKKNLGCAKASKVDITANPGYAKLRGVNLEIEGVPSVYLFPFGQYRSFEKYEGPRNADAILRWLYKRLNGLGICNAIIPEMPY